MYLVDSRVSGICLLNYIHSMPIQRSHEWTLVPVMASFLGQYYKWQRTRGLASFPCWPWNVATRGQDCFIIESLGSNEATYNLVSLQTKKHTCASWYFTPGSDCNYLSHDQVLTIIGNSRLEKSNFNMKSSPDTLFQHTSCNPHWYLVYGN